MSNSRLILLRYGLLSWISLFFLFAGCVLPAPPPNSSQGPWIQDERILTSAPCSPPCWQGITPGRSHLDEALTLLTDLPLVDNSTVRQYELTPELLKVVWAYTEPRAPIYSSGGLFFKDRIVERIEVGLPRGLALSELVHVYGEPTWIGSEDQWAREDGYSVLHAIYPAQGIALGEILFSSSDLQAGTIQLSPGLLVHNIEYFTPVENLDQYFLQIRHFGGDATDRLKRFYFPWTGLNGIIDIP